MTCLKLYLLQQNTIFSVEQNIPETLIQHFTKSDKRFCDKALPGQRKLLSKYEFFRYDAIQGFQ